MAVKVPLLVRNCQLGLEKTTASPVRSHLEIISHLLPVHLAAYVSLALSKRLCRKEKHPCPSGAKYVSSMMRGGGKIELNQPDSPLRLPPRPGLLQNGCCWQRPPERVDATCTQNTQESAACAEVSLTETCSAESEEISPPSEVPEPASQGQATESPRP